MSSREKYKYAHKFAKFITCMIVIMLLVMNRHYHTIYLDVAAVTIWFFGINPIAYIIEEINGWAHRHDKL